MRRGRPLDPPMMWSDVSFTVGSTVEFGTLLRISGWPNHKQLEVNECQM